MWDVSIAGKDSRGRRAGGATAVFLEKARLWPGLGREMVRQIPQVREMKMAQKWGRGTWSRD